VVPHLGGLQVAEGLHGGAVAHELDKFREVLERGARRLKQIGMDPVAKLAVGDPARVIGEFPVELPRPRDQIRTRSSPRFMELRAALYHAIKGKPQGGPS